MSTLLRNVVIPISIGLALSLAWIAIVIATRPASAAECRASWYGGGEYLNAHTATGERFDTNGLTAAHRSLRFGTRLKVSHRGRSVIVRINDRGPAKWTGRCLDLSRGAAKALGMIAAGVATVSFQVIR